MKHVSAQTTYMDAVDFQLNFVGNVAVWHLLFRLFPEFQLGLNKNSQHMTTHVIQQHTLCRSIRGCDEQGLERVHGALPLGTASLR